MDWSSDMGGLERAYRLDKEYMLGMRLGWALCEAENPALYESILRRREAEILEAKRELRSHPPVAEGE